MSWPVTLIGDVRSCAPRRVSVPVPIAGFGPCKPGPRGSPGETRTGTVTTPRRSVAGSGPSGGNLKIGAYTSIFATAEHAPITSLAYLRQNRYDNSLGLFKRGVCLGSAALRLEAGKDLYTTSVFLKKAHRRKGHGVPLYLHLIFTAQALGARRLYSDTRLNKYSRRMWSEKLAKLFDVKVCKKRMTCSRCGCRPKKDRYYLELKGLRKP